MIMHTCHENEYMLAQALQIVNSVRLSFAVFKQLCTGTQLPPRHIQNDQTSSEVPNFSLLQKQLLKGVISPEILLY